MQVVLHLDAKNVLAVACSGSHNYPLYRIQRHPLLVCFKLISTIGGSGTLCSKGGNRARERLL